MKPKTIADTKDWKNLMSDVRTAKKDPEFRKALDRFIKISSNHE